MSKKKKFILKNTKKKTTKSPEGETPTPSVEPAPMAPPPVDSGSAMPPPPTDSESTLPPAPGEMDSTMPPSDMGGGMPPAPSDMGGGMPPAPSDMGGDMGGGDMPPPSDMGGDMEGGEMPPAPSDMGGGMPPPSDMGGDMPEPMGDEESTGGGKTRKMSDFKRIQILVGKLAQKIRTYEESDDLSPKDIKYIINSILSAIDVQALDEDDIEQIISKLEGEDEDEEGGTEDVSDEEEVVNDGGEMDEEYTNYGKSVHDYLKGAVSSIMGSKLKESDDFDVDNTEDSFMKFNEKRNQNKSEVSIEDLEDSDTDIEDFKIRRAMKRRPSNSHYHFNRGTYNESKIDKILMGYFKLNENEIKQKYSRLVESDFQMRSLSSFLNENPNSTYMGKTTKGNLIFKNGNKEVKITKSGTLI